MDIEDILGEIHENCLLLYDGYHENVEYAVEVAYHRANCHWYKKVTVAKDDCECPVVTEKRVSRKKRRGYLEQLREFAQNKDTDRNTKAERGAPRVKQPGRPPGDMAGFFALDEITCDIIATTDRILDEAGRDRAWAAASARVILMGLSGQVGHFAEARPDLAREVLRSTRRWLDSARSTLRVSTRDSIFDSVTCGNCGGALSTPAGNRGEADVRCIGSPDTPPCGETYPPSEWLTLYERTKGVS